MCPRCYRAERPDIADCPSALPSALLSLRRCCGRLQELAGELGGHLAKNAVSVEQSLRVVYMPQAVFRVRPVARCTASMAGHSESVLVVAFSPDGRRLATGSGDTTLRFWDLNTQLPQFECKVRCGGRQPGTAVFRVPRHQLQPTVAVWVAYHHHQPPVLSTGQPCLFRSGCQCFKGLSTCCVRWCAVGPQELGAVCGMVP